MTNSYSLSLINHAKRLIDSREFDVSAIIDGRKEMIACKKIDRDGGIAIIEGVNADYYIDMHKIIGFRVEEKP